MYKLVKYNSGAEVTFACSVCFFCLHENAGRCPVEFALEFERVIHSTRVHLYFQTVLPKARLVFAVELEGSARKLVTVRSALQVANKLSHAIEIKMETSLNQLGCRLCLFLATPSTVRAIIDVSLINVKFLLSDLILTSANIGRMQLPAQSVMSLPLSHIGVQMCFKPLIPNSQFQYCTESVNWTVVKKPMEVMENHITCRTNQNNIFRCGTATFSLTKLFEKLIIVNAVP